MAISKNPLLQGVSGSLNKQIIIRQLNNKTVISAYGDYSSRKQSPKQKLMANLMKQANITVRQIINDPAQRDAALIRLDVRRNQLYHALIGEFMRKGK